MNSSGNSAKIPAESHADKVLKLVIARGIVWLVIVLCTLIERIVDTGADSRYKGGMSMLLGVAWLYTGEIIMDIFIIREGSKGLKSKKRTRSLICLIMIPGTWLLIFLLIALVAIITSQH